MPQLQEDRSRGTAWLYYAKQVTAILSGLSVGAFFLIASIRLAWASVKLNLESFGFTDLMSLIMSLFAISLSVAFYLKATQSSNAFYDNTYKFTQETSTLLGQIQAGFGEQLRHLGEGYTGLSHRLDAFPVQLMERARMLSVQSEQEQKKIQQGESDLKAIFEQLLASTNLQDEAKVEFRQKLDAKDTELRSARAELEQLQEKLAEVDKATSLPPHLVQYLQVRIMPQLREGIAGKNLKAATLEETSIAWDAVVPRTPRGILDLLTSLGFISANRSLTSEGFSILQALG